MYEQKVKAGVSGTCRGYRFPATKAYVVPHPFIQPYGILSWMIHKWVDHGDARLLGNSDSKLLRNGWMIETCKSKIICSSYAINRICPCRALSNTCRLRQYGNDIQTRHDEAATWYGQPSLRASQTMKTRYSGICWYNHTPLILRNANRSCELIDRIQKWTLVTSVERYDLDRMPMKRVASPSGMHYQLDTTTALASLSSSSPDK